MPVTFFAHQAVVIPLKWARPRWFDGTALCIGSMAPDLAYALAFTPASFPSHTWIATVLWSVPLTWLLTWLVRCRIAEPLGRQLPSPLGPELRALARSRPRWPITFSSAWLGVLSHLFVDGFTHPGGWAFDRFAWLSDPVLYLGVHPISSGRLLQYIGHSFGTAAGIALITTIVRRGLISRWHGPAALTAADPDPWFWPAAGLGCCAAASLAALSAVITGGGLPVGIIRASWAALLVLTLMTELSLLLSRWVLGACRGVRPH